jgi:hypothetical protein
LCLIRVHLRLSAVQILLVSTRFSSALQEIGLRPLRVLQPGNWGLGTKIYLPVGERDKQHRGFLVCLASFPFHILRARKA